jgi:adenosine deaminase
VSSPFQAALEAHDLGGLRACAKADLHVHAGVTSGDRAFLKERAGLDIRPVDRVLASMDDMHAWVRGQVGDRFDRMPGRMLGIEATFVQARRDGVTRLEAGEDVWAITLHDGSAQAVWAMLQAAHARGGPGVEWIPQLGLSRHCPVPALERWLAPFLELGVFRTLDLSGDEFARPVGEFAPLYRRAKAAGLRLKAHVGEWGTADDVWRAVELLELDEVQHGIAAAASLAAMRFLAQSGVQLNVCPTSNVKLGRVARMEEHPIRRLFDAGVRVTVGSDDPLVFGTSLSAEFLTLSDAGVMTPAELDAVRLQALSGPVLAAARAVSRRRLQPDQDS